MLLDITSAFYSWIQGGFLVLFVYHLVIYIQNKDTIHKYYSIYLFCLTVYLFRETFTSNTIQYIYEYVSFTIQLIAYVAFIFFTRTIANSKKQFPKLDKLIVLLSNLLLILVLILILVQYFLGYEAQKKVVAYSLPFLTFCAFLIFYILSKNKTKQVFYLILGSVLFLIFANISSIKMLKGDGYLLDFEVHYMFYYFVGAIVQSIIFAVLIGNYFTEITNKKKEAEINLLKQNHQIAELKMMSLQNQMNPHFLFNSLNSINNFVVQNKIEKASSFITKFSYLVRKVLQATSSNLISLKDELEIITTYIKLEQMRLKNSFVFTQIIDKRVNQEKLKVVPLFVQPFVENAIWHGLSPKKGNKELSLSIQLLKNNLLQVKIIDNGIGLNEANKKKSKDRKSFGINIAKERLKLIYGKEVKISIVDMSSSKKTSGTSVLITFPYVF